ncbi:DNA methyltransferase [Margalitia sp. FSL K6-0131]|uniref:DNA methyltransferase n=1 Tax=Margalitia sp. FSL K6-0131 TaxID=2954604 RepID=UPI0030F5EDEA
MDLLSIKRKISQITPTNRNPLYQSHLYWSQKPYNICDILIEELTEEGDIIFDPFMGSGVTIIEAALHNRKGVGVEINELPIFIVDTLLKKVEVVEELLNEFELFLDSLQSYYETWSDEFNTVGVINKIIFDRPSPFSEPEIKEIYYKCKGNKNAVVKKPDIFDSEKMLANNGYQQIRDFIMIPNSRLAVQNNQSVSTLFTPRALSIIDEILQYIARIHDNNQRNVIQYILMSSLHLIKITDTKSNSQWPLWTPKENCLEKNAIDVLKKRIGLLRESFKYLANYSDRNLTKGSSFEELLTNCGYYIIHNGIQNITQGDIPDNSVDLVITDPPYLGQVLYSEYMQLYYPFLDLHFNIEDEIVVSKAQGRNKDEDNYFQLLNQGFEKISRKLKRGKLLCMYFHESNLSVWNKLINIMKQNGLYFLTQVHVPKKKSTLKNILSPKKSLQGDSILFFIKETGLYREPNENESLEEVVSNVLLHVEYELSEKGPLTTTQLIDDGLMEIIIQNGWLEQLSQNYKSIVDVFEPKVNWDDTNGKWYI